MHYDNAKVEEAVLALLGVFEFENGRAWSNSPTSTVIAPRLAKLQHLT